MTGDKTIKNTAGEAPSPKGSETSEAKKTSGPKRNVKQAAKWIRVAARTHGAHIYAVTQMARREHTSQTSGALNEVVVSVTKETHMEKYEEITEIIHAFTTPDFIPSFLKESLPEEIQAPLRTFMETIVPFRFEKVHLEALKLMRFHTSMFMPSYSIDEQLQWSVSGDPSKQDDIAALFKGLEERPDILSLWNDKVHIALLRLLDAFPKDDAQYREFDDIIDRLDRQFRTHTNSH